MEEEEDIVCEQREFWIGCECGKSGDVGSVVLSNDGAVFICIALMTVQVSR
jgi:hypothetical protein